MPPMVVVTYHGKILGACRSGYVKIDEPGYILKTTRLDILERAAGDRWRGAEGEGEGTLGFLPIPSGCRLLLIR